MGPGSTAMGITPYRFCIAPGASIRQLSLSNASSGVAPRETSTGKSVHLDPATRLLLSSQAGASGETRVGREPDAAKPAGPRDPLAISGNRVASPSGPVADVFHVEHVGDGAIFPLKALGDSPPRLHCRTRVM